MESTRAQVNAAPPAAPRRRGARPALPLALTLALALALPGCGIFASPVIDRGHRVSEEQLKDITPGVHTRADVQAMLGSPSASSTFGDRNWFYISSRTRTRPMRTQGVSDPETVVIEFDDRNVVRQVRVIREPDMPTVTMVARETPTPGNDRTLLQALFGNIGRFGAVPGGDQNPGAPSAPR
jgi:outer membrane protein assembly factor BamE (lipoprotein component of BamABCDE complex)